MQRYTLLIRIAFLSFFVLFSSAPTFAQRSLRCPKPKKERKYNEPRILNYMDVHVFGTLPFAYRYKGRFKDPYFKAATAVGFGANFQNHLVLSDKIELLVDGMGVMNQQGLSFRYQQGGSMGSNRHFVTSAQYRLSVGVSYNISDRLSIAAAPSIVYNTVMDYSNNGRTTSNTSGTTTIDINWGDMERYDETWYAGACFHARYNFSRRFFASFMTAIDFAPSSPSSGAVTIASNGVLEEHSVYKNPYLMFVGLGLGVRVYQVNRGGY